MKTLLEIIDTTNELNKNLKQNKMKNKITPPPIPPKDINEWFEYISAITTKIIIAGFVIEILYHTTKSI